MNNLTLANIHPGEVLREEFLLPLGITAYRLATAAGIPHSRLSAILAAKRSITPDTALRLGRILNMEPQFWLRLQQAYDLEEILRARPEEYNALQPIVV